MNKQALEDHKAKAKKGEKYLPIPSNTVIHCKTEAEAVSCQQILFKMGYMWQSCGNKAIFSAPWELYKKDLCFRPSVSKTISYAGESYYKKIGMLIIEFENFKYRA